MSEHTKGPWTQDNGVYLREGEVGISNTRRRICVIGNGDGCANANAAFIVRACNCHEGLVEALDRLLEMAFVVDLRLDVLRNETKPDASGQVVYPCAACHGEFKKAMTDARAALAKAKGETAHG